MNEADELQAKLVRNLRIELDTLKSTTLGYEETAIMIKVVLHGTEQLLSLLEAKAA